MPDPAFLHHREDGIRCDTPDTPCHSSVIVSHRPSGTSPHHKRVLGEAACGFALTPPPPGGYPRFAELGDLSQLLSGDHAHHGLPPGVDWLWLAFPESWPYLRLQPGNYPGPTAPIAEAGDLWWFTVADLQAHGGLWGSGWLELLVERIAARFVGSLVSAFNLLGALPLIWTVPSYERPPVPAFQPHYRLQFGGSLFTVEGWSCRLNITSAGTLMDSAAADAAFPALWAAVQSWVQR